MNKRNTMLQDNNKMEVKQKIFKKALKLFAILMVMVALFCVSLESGNAVKIPENAVVLTALDNEKPTVSEVYTNLSGTYYKLTLDSEVPLSSIKDANGQEELKNISALGTSGVTNVYIQNGTRQLKVYDTLDGCTDVYYEDAQLDNKRPDADISYINGKYIIKARDGESGLWKITDLSGNTLGETEYNGEADYSGTYPKSQQMYSADGPAIIDSVVVFDAVGNSKTVYLDNQPPRGSGFFYNNKIKVTVCDEESGLWKITEHNDINEAPLVEFEGETEQQTVVAEANLTTVYAFDQAGNSTKIVLREDVNAPQAEGYYSDSSNKIKITACDEESGLWKITENNNVDDEPLVEFEGQIEPQTVVLESELQVVYVFDQAGHSTKVILERDREAPQATIKYIEGDIKIDVSDTKSGIAKIDDIEYPDYPSTVENFEVLTGTVQLVDAVGNSDSISVDITSASAQGFYNGNKIKVTAKDEESGLWKVAETGNIKAKPMILFNGEQTEQTAIIESELNTVYVFNQAGNAYKLELNQDTEGPTAQVSYNAGQITIDVQDQDSGVWKIGQTEYGEYPATVEDFVVETGTHEVQLKDALGNEGSIEIDYTGPTADGFYNGERIKVIAKDTESGLWKITANNNSEDEALFTFEANQEEQIIVLESELDKVYVFDQAGNSSEVALTLIEDGPTATPSYNQGEITIDVEDLVLGIWKVGETEYQEYPTNVADYHVDTGTQTVILLDAIGNVGSVDIDHEVESAYGFYNGEKIKVIACDTDSGLWKITDGTEQGANVLVSFDGTKEEQVVVLESELDTVYVYDQAGNYKEVELTLDDAAPTVIPTYQTGRITIAVEDLKSGIAKIGETEYGEYPSNVDEYVVTSRVVTVTDALGNIQDVEIHYTVPEASGFYNGTKIKVTAKDDESGLWKITENNDIEEDGLFEFQPNTDEQTIVLESELDTVYVFNQAGNSTMIELTQDENGPTGEVTYNAGQITIDIQDQDSGVWKIGQTEYGEYPATVEDFVIETGTHEVQLKDALGNEGSIEIDYTGPIADGFYNGEKIKVIAKDTESGLWKITANDDSEEEPLFTFEANQEEQTIVLESELDTVYVFDQAGNSTIVELTIDNDAPIATPNYNAGQITIDVEDEGSGIWKVDQQEYLEYPTNLNSLEVETGTKQVLVVDALGTQATLAIDHEVNVVSGFYNGEKIKVVAQDTDSGLWKITDSTEQDANVLVSFDGTKEEQVVVLESELDTVYVYDQAGNYKEVELALDDVPPSVTISYENGITTIDVEDLGSGIAQIGEDEYANYQECVEDYVVITNQVVVADALGNEDTIDMGYTTPIAQGFYNGSKIKVIAKDLGSGLWKLTEHNNVSEEAIYTFVANTEEQTIILASELDTVYVFNQAGFATKLELTEDKEAPNFDISYQEGSIKLDIVDSKSGIATIDNTDYEGIEKVEQYEVETGTEEVELADVLGNITTVAIDHEIQKGEGFYNGSCIKVVAQDTDSGLWKITDSTEVGATELATFEGIKEEQIVILESELATVYVYDQAGNVKEVELVYDDTAPIATPEYSQGRITIDVQDNDGSGIAIIGDTNYSEYPNSVENFNVVTGTQEVIVKDALGNQGSIAIDHTIQSASGFYNGNYIKVTAQDTGSGLWKITDGTQEDSQILETFEANTYEKTVVLESSLDTVYVYDQAGNFVEVELIEDVNCPTVEVLYENGQITIVAQDEEAGIAKIGQTTYTSYPNAVSDYNVILGTENVTIIDALGNDCTVDIDYTAPEAVGFYNGQELRVTAKDTESGLWKVTSATNVQLATFTPSNTEQETVTVELDAEIDKVYVYDMAGNRSQIDLVIDSEEPTAEGFYNGRKIKVIAQDEVSGLWKLTDGIEANANVLETFEGTTEQQIVVLESDLQTVYVYDLAGNVKELNLNQDETAPVVTPVYHQGEITLVVEDDGVGIAQIGDTEYNNYEDSIEDYIVEPGTETVTVVDVLGNSVEVDIDHEGPDAYGFYNGTKIKVVATDTDSGVWKITNGTQQDAEVLATFEDDIQEGVAVLESDLQVVYVYDQAGNISEVELQQDEDVPEVQAFYQNGNITLVATDAKSGIAKIGVTEYETYPDSVDNYVVGLDEETVVIIDALGNQTSIEIDRQEPEAEGFYNGTCIEVTAMDTVSGLWKITDGTDINAQELVTFNGTTEQKRVAIESDLEVVYVYDMAGNIAVVELSEDLDAPTIVPVRVDGEITLVVTDSKAGIKRVGNTSYDNGDYPATMTYIVQNDEDEVILEDALGNTTTVEINRTNPIITNVYQAEDGITIMTLSDDCGIKEVRYCIDEEVVDTVEFEDVPESVVVEVPANVQSVVAVDWFGNEETLDIVNTIKPIVRNIYRKDANVYCMETSGISEIYYKDQGVNQTILSNLQDINTITLQEGVTTIYVTDENENEVEIDLSNVPSQVTKAMLSQDGIRMLARINSTKTITSLEYQNEDEELITTLNVNDTIISGIKSVSQTTRAFKMVYQDGRTCRVWLDKDIARPSATNLVRLENGNIMIKLEDQSGIAKVRYIEQEEEHEILIPGEKTSIVQELNLPVGVTSIIVEDMFGDTTEVGVGETAIETDVQDMATNRDGSVILLNLTSTKVIERIEYSDLEGIHEIPVNDTVYNEVIEANGAENITLVYEDGTTSDILLVVDETKPVNESLFTNASRTRYKTIIQDNRGIQSIEYAGQVITEELENHPKKVVLQVNIVNASMSSYGQNMRVMSDDDTVTISITSDEAGGVVKVRNVLNNVTRLNLSEPNSIDSAGPRARVEYYTTHFLIKAQDAGSGLVNIVDKATGEEVLAIPGYPKDEWTSPEMEYASRDRIFLIYDGVGNKSELTVVKNDAEGPEVLWAYKNMQYEYIHVGLREMLGLKDIKDQDGKTRVVFNDNPTHAVAKYELRDGDTAFTVTDVADNGTLVKLDDVTLHVHSAYKNANGDKIVIEMYDIVNGISKVTYTDGREIPVEVIDGIQYKKCYEVDEGTTRLWVYQNDGETFTEVLLDLDSKGPKLEPNDQGGQSYRNTAGDLVIIKPVDYQSGLKKIIVGDTVLELQCLPKQILKQMVTNGVEKIVLYDAFDNVTRVRVAEIEKDETKPTGRIEYIPENDNYVLTVQDMQSGLWKVVRNEEIDEPYEDFDLRYPREEKEVTLDTIIGLRKLQVFDAVGNVYEIDMSGVRCIITYAYISQDGSRMALSAYDTRGIVKLGIVDENEDEKIIEVFRGRQQRIRKSYDIPQGIQAINFYSFDDVTREDLEVYAQIPEVTGDLVSSKVGIRRVEYDDGTNLEFTKNEPNRTRVTLEGHEWVHVYDALGNVAVLESA